MGCLVANGTERAALGGGPSDREAWRRKLGCRAAGRQGMETTRASRVCLGLNVLLRVQVQCYGEFVLWRVRMKRLPGGMSEVL